MGAGLLLNRQIGVLLTIVWRPSGSDNEAIKQTHFQEETNHEKYRDEGTSDGSA